MTRPIARLGAAPSLTTGSGYPWADGDILNAADLNAAFLPASGGQLSGNLVIEQPAGIGNLLIGKTSGAQEHATWVIELGDNAAETGGNHGSNFGIQRYSDANTLIDQPLTITRNDGFVGINTELFVTGPVTISPYGVVISADINSTAFIQDATGSRWEYVRANGTIHWIRGSDNAILFSIDTGGNVIAKGTITPSGTPAAAVDQQLTDRVAALEARIAMLEAK